MYKIMLTQILANVIFFVCDSKVIIHDSRSGLFA